MDSKQTYCLGGRHMSSTVKVIECEKVNPKKKLVKVRKGKCDFCGPNKSQIFVNDWRIFSEEC